MSNPKWYRKCAALALEYAKTGDVPLDHYVVLWSPKGSHGGIGEILVVPRGFPAYIDTRYVDRFPFSRGPGVQTTPLLGVDGAKTYAKLTRTEKVLELLLDFHSVVVLSGVEPAAAHREFSKIKEYREHMFAELCGRDGNGHKLRTPNIIEWDAKLGERCARYMDSMSGAMADEG